MRKLGELYASSLSVGGFIRLRGIEQKVTKVTIKGSVVFVETEMFEPVRFDLMERVSFFY